MKEASNNRKAPFFGISRHRMGTDGEGITTLVCFMGCPLHCRYCLNNQCHDGVYEHDGRTLRKGVALLSPAELYDRVKIDDLYFQTTGGGICFGGGEPMLYPLFIREFRQLCGKKWKITVETSLECRVEAVRMLADIVDRWIVDIKELDDERRKAYTGSSVSAKHLLETLKEYVPVDKVAVRIPHIPDVNTQEEIQIYKAEIQKLGFANVDNFTYITNIGIKSKRHG